MENCLSNARLLSKALEATGWYICVSDIHRAAGVHTFQGLDAPVFGREEETSADYNAGLPVVAFRFSHTFRKDYPKAQQASVSTLMRARQYIIPNYALPPNEQETDILRIVVRESMSFDLLDRLVQDLIQVTQSLMESGVEDLSFVRKRTGTWTKPQKGGKMFNALKEGDEGKEEGKGKKLMAEGVHRSVC
jgi:glutamate decarboxylase